MSSVTKEFTKEQLIEQAKKNIEVLRGAVEKIPGSSDAAVIHLKLAEITLASLEAEPVAWTDTDELRDAKNGGVGYLFAVGGDTNKYADPRRQLMLYIAHPVPVSVPDENGLFPCPFCGGRPEEDAGGCSEYDGHEHQDYSINCKSCGAEVYCAAGSFEKADIPCSCHHNAREVCVEKWNRRAAMLQGADGNSPVIPDGWVMVPVEPTAEMLQSGISAHYERSQIQIHDRPAPGPMECAYVAMLTAAPQQEVKP